MTQTLKAATYNVHRFIGLDGLRDPERTFRVIDELNADIVALQEVTYPRASDPEHSPLNRLARSAGYECIVSPALREDTGAFGNVLLVRGEVGPIDTVDLAVVNREPRSAIVARARVGGVEVCIAASHFGLGARERGVQADRLIRAMQDIEAPIVIVAGDFNFWSASSRGLRRLEARFGRTPRPRTFPTRRPVFSLDRIWVDPAHRLRDTRVHRSTRARVASDHLPLVVSIETTRA